jgi:hypothetical protein
MADIFGAVANKYRNTPSVIVLFIASVVMLLIGINHFVEDTYSSYLGLKSLETAFSMNVQIFDWTYWTMSLAPQIASIIFFYIYLSNTEESGWALWVSLLAQVIDFFADVWYRSNGVIFQDGKVAIISILLTFGYFTLGSEVFVTVGCGLVLKLYAPALSNWKEFVKEVKRVKGQFKGQSQTNNFDTSHKSGYKPQHKPNQGKPMNMPMPKDNPVFPMKNQSLPYHPIPMQRKFDDDELE